MAEASEACSASGSTSAPPAEPRSSHKLLGDDPTPAALPAPAGIAPPLSSPSKPEDAVAAAEPVTPPPPPAAAAAGAGAGEAAVVYGTALSGPHLDESSPFREPAAGYTSCTSLCLLRVKRDVRSMLRHPPDGIHIYPDPEDITKIHALLEGREGTPYHGGFFYFILRCPPDYPNKPPHVRFMTTGQGTVRFNPNLYQNGKVCLSILGTWAGPGWSAAQSISSVLVSIHSLMNEVPFHNEPGHDKPIEGDTRPTNYNQCLVYETLRVAVCDTVDSDACPYALRFPKSFTEIVQSSFLEHLDMYRQRCTDNTSLDGQALKDPFRVSHRPFEFAKMLVRLDSLEERVRRLQAEAAAVDSEDDDEG